MAALKGNHYWKLRNISGRDKIYKTPEELGAACNEYFQFCIDNPLKEEQIVKYKDYYDLVEVPKLRAFTLSGLCNYLDICESTFKNYAKDKDLLPVVTRVKQIIYNQKFEGSAAGQLNPNIIALDLGLRAKTEIEHTGTIVVDQMTSEEREERIRELKKKLKNDSD